jgi:anthranilate phosphoribosyltransferase
MGDASIGAEIQLVAMLILANMGAKWLKHGDLRGT